MNYRHAYHAGNFCDVLKHSVLALCLRYLGRKEAPYFVLDTHAGIGLYDLAAPEAQKTGEALAGIGRLIASDHDALPDGIARLLKPYLDIIAALNPSGLARYPGSPDIARRLARPHDRLTFCELHPEDVRHLRHNMRHDRRIHVEQMDGWQALKALLPPPERRGLILVDPAFEERDEMQRLAQGFRHAHRRFATGVIMLWYPIKDRVASDRLGADIRANSAAELLSVELMVRHANDPSLLNGTGLIIANPPFTLAQQLQELLPFLAERLAQGEGAGWRVNDMQNA